jgi:hypothetical protein
MEIVIPLRNPTAVLQKTVQSLVAQTDREFTVLLSDNGSADNAHLAEAVRTLHEAGIATRTVRPPEELGRVEHWNWSHRQAEAEWIKPLFVGDWLDAGYVAATRRAIANTPAEIVNCSMRRHFPDGATDDTLYPEGYRTPEAVLAEAFRDGNNFGGPINVCFRKLAFELVGGYPPALPVSADFWLILMLALRRGLYTCHEVLGHFNYHPDRYTTNFPYHRINGDRELFIILLAATSHANFAELPAPTGTRNRFFGRLLKRTLKQQLQRLSGKAAP